MRKAVVVLLAVVAVGAAGVLWWGRPVDRRVPVQRPVVTTSGQAIDGAAVMYACNDRVVGVGTGSAPSERFDVAVPGGADVREAPWSAVITGRHPDAEVVGGELRLQRSWFGTTRGTFVGPDGARTELVPSDDWFFEGACDRAF